MKQTPQEEMQFGLQKTIDGCFRLITSFILLLFPCLVSEAQTTESDNRSNVLFLVVDDLNTWLLNDSNRYTGKVIAPNIRKLANSGVNFTRAYTASPKCSPSRTAVFSGIAPWKSGLWENGQDIDESKVITSVTHLAKFFREHGYYTGKSGKITHGYDQQGNWDEVNRGKNISTRTASPLNAPLNGWAKSKSGKPTETDWGPTHRGEEDMYDTQHANWAVGQLQKKHEKPFFIACGLFHPHMPWYVPQKYLDMYPLDEIVIPDFRKDDLDDVPPLGRAFSSTDTMETILEKGQHKEAIQGYLASTTFADAQIGRVLDALEKSAYGDNTLVVLWSDHGFHLGEKLHWQKGTLWEEATHNLLIFRVPGLTQAGGVSTQLVSLLDLYPTLVDLCGLPDPGHLDGESLVPLLKEPSARLRTHVITAYDGQIAVRTDQYRYIRYSDGNDELYANSEDPHEWVNLSRNADFARVKTKLNALLPLPEEMPESLSLKKQN